MIKGFRDSLEIFVVSAVRETHLSCKGIILRVFSKKTFHYGLELSDTQGLCKVTCVRHKVSLKGLEIW